AIAWCLSNDKVSTVMIGASSPEQLKQNLKSLGVVAKLTPEVKAKIDAVVPICVKPAAPDMLSGVRARHL
ncbi:hypothetical protein PI124_g12085, partial [Phytophthora idaei]